MINNQAFTDAIKASAPKIAFKLVFDDEIISSDNFLIEASLDFICTSFVGQLSSWKFTATWLVVDSFKSYENREFEVHVGAYPFDNGNYLDEPVYVPMGLFTVPEGQQKSNDINRMIEIVAYDRVQNLNKKYEPLVFGEEGLTGLEIRNELASRNGLELKQPTPKLIKDDFSDFTPYQGATVTRNKTFPIEVFKGGRNLLLETDNYRAFNSNSETLEIKHNNSSVYRVTVSNPDVNNNFGMFFNRFTNASLLEVGKEYVISVDYFIEGFYGVEGSNAYIRLTYIDDTVETFYYYGSNGLVNFRVENNWNKWHTLSGNFTPTKEVKNVWFYFYAGKVNNASVLYTVPKIELGSTPTEYSPAPEDGYDYQGSDGAYHIQTSGGANNLKYFRNTGVSELDVTYQNKVNIVAWENMRVGNNFSSTTPLKLNELNEIVQVSKGNGTTNLFMTFQTLEPSDSLDFIASDPMIIEGEEFVPFLKFDNTVFESLNIGVGQAITDLEVLRQYLTLNMAFGFVGRSGLLETRNVFTSKPIGDGVSADFDFASLKLEKEYGPINSLVYSNKATGDDRAYQSIEASDQESIERYGRKSLEFSDNAFIDLLTLEEKQVLIADLFKMINGFKYTPFSIEEFFARPDFDPGDVLTLTNSEGVESLVPITSMSYQYNGGLLGTMGTKELPQVLPKKPIPNIYERVTNTEIIVDRLGNKITLEVSDLNSKVTDLGTEVRGNHNQIMIDINGITDRVTTVESDLETNYSTIEFSNDLTRNAIDGLTNTYSRLGGANLVMNSALYHGLEDDYDHWRGNLVRLISDTTKSRTAIGLKNGTVYQDIANVQTGWISLRFYVGIQAGLDDGQVQFKINETLYDVVPNNFVEMSFEHTQSDIELSFITNMSDKYYISDLMMNYGKDMFLDYQQAQNELHTSSVQISERIRVESNVVNTITYLGANGLEGYNKSTGDLVFKQTDTGLEAVSIKSGDAEIAGIAITLVGNQTWFTGL